MASAIPASVRHRNPSAMSLGPAAKRFGATKSTRLNDGEGNTIATFPTSVDGAAAMWHLLYTGSYNGMTVWNALYRWGGGEALAKRGRAELARERTDGYVASIARRSRFRRNDKIAADWLEDPVRAIEWGKAMAWHEAGQEYPMTDEQWAEAHDEFMTVLKGGRTAIDKVKPFAVTGPLEYMRDHLGEREIAGGDDNPWIVGCFEEIGARYRDDETSWCAASLGRSLKEAGCAYIEGDAGCGARNYINYGHAIDEPEEGCVVVFWRVSPSDWRGHVAFVESFTATTLTIIGGNQSNAVTRMTVPRTGSRSQVLGYRRPVPAITPAVVVAKDESMQRKAVGGLGAASAFLWSIWGYVEAVGQWAGEAIGVLPHVANTASSAVSTGQSLAQSAGVPWPVQLGLFITICALGFGAYSTWRRLRPNKGEVTKPPYETDIEPVESDDVEDVFSAEVVELKPKKRAAKPRAKSTTRRKAA